MLLMGVWRRFGILSNKIVVLMFLGRGLLQSLFIRRLVSFAYDTLQSVIVNFEDVPML
ncbi:hypothetical protein PMIT1320_01820 [Prochlorococcus marinus str. MIT 1320]|nr:hypothetical protein PMIT1320_01820 [Prochlorococcus marinus str. MIT 1320]